MKHRSQARPPRKILTSGCTGGVSFGKYLDDIEQFRVTDDSVRVAPSTMYSLLRDLYDRSNLYRESGGGQYLGTLVVTKSLYPKEAIAEFRPARRVPVSQLRSEELPRKGDTVGIISSGASNRLP